MTSYANWIRERLDADRMVPVCPASDMLAERVFLADDGCHYLEDDAGELHEVAGELEAAIASICEMEDTLAQWDGNTEPTLMAVLSMMLTCKTWLALRFPLADNFEDLHAAWHAVRRQTEGLATSLREQIQAAIA